MEFATYVDTHIATCVATESLYERYFPERLRDSRILMSGDNRKRP